MIRVVQRPPSAHYSSHSTPYSKNPIHQIDYYMFEFLRRWCDAIHQFGLETVRLQNYCAIPYLMAVNSLFCFICFYAPKEAQLRAIYGLISFVLCVDLIFIKRDHNLVLVFFTWIFADFLRSISVILLAFSVQKLHYGEQQKAFSASLGAVSLLVLSPLYRHHQINAKLAEYARKLGRAFKGFLARFLVRPLLIAWEWCKFILLLRWLPLLGSHLRTCFMAIYDWFDGFIFAPLCRFGRQLRAWALYFLLFHWCSDLWRFARRILLDPLCIQLGRLLDGFVYIFGCYWLKPLLFHIGRAFRDLLKSTLHSLGKMSLSLASLAFEHLIYPTLLLACDYFGQFGIYVHEKAIRPLLLILYRKYRMVEDLLLINVLGPILKKFLDALPQRNPFEQESDNELDEFMPDIDDEEEEEGPLPTTSSRLLELPAGSEPDLSASEDNSSPLLSPQSSFEEDEKALASGLRNIDISGSDSDTDAFLPSFRRRRRLKETLSLSESAL